MSSTHLQPCLCPSYSPALSLFPGMRVIVVDRLDVVSAPAALPLPLKLICALTVSRPGGNRGGLAGCRQRICNLAFAPQTHLRSHCFQAWRKLWRTGWMSSTHLQPCLCLSNSPALSLFPGLEEIVEDWLDVVNASAALPLPLILTCALIVFRPGGNCGGLAGGGQRICNLAFAIYTPPSQTAPAPIPIPASAPIPAPTSTPGAAAAAAAAAPSRTLLGTGLR